MKKLALLLVLLSSTAFADNAEKCESYQFTQGTPEFSNCMMQLDMAETAALQAAQQQLDAQRRAAAMQMYRPFSIAPSTYNYQMPTNPMRRQTNCQWFGNVWNCQ